MDKVGSVNRGHLLIYNPAGMTECMHGNLNQPSLKEKLDYMQIMFTFFFLEQILKFNATLFAYHLHAHGI